MRVIKTLVLRVWLLVGWVRVEEHKIVLRAATFQHKLQKSLEPEQMVDLYDKVEILA